GRPAASLRLDKHAIAHKPDLLVISYGLNDARGGTPLALFAEEMETIIDKVRQQISPLVILLGPYYMTNFDGYGPYWNKASLKDFQAVNDLIAAVARKKDCLFVELLSAYDGADWMVHYDGVHATTLGIWSWRIGFSRCLRRTVPDSR